MKFWRPGPARGAAPALLCLVLASAGCGGPRPTVVPLPHPVDPLDELRRDIAALLQEPALSRTTWGVSVRSLSADRSILEMNADALLLPASAMKVVTLAVAADTLGWDFSYETVLAGVGAIDFGYLDGDLLVVGSGDPSIDDWDGAASRLFQGWAERLKALGVRTIGGRIIGDDNSFEDEGLGAGWAWDDLNASFAAGVGALQFNQNTVRVLLTPGPAAGDAAIAALVPEGSGLELRLDVTTGPREAVASIQARRLPGSSRLELRGSVPAGSPPFFRNVSVDNPTRYFVSALHNALVASGIEVRGGVADIDDLANAPPRSDGVPLIVHRSPPLAVLAATMMKNSQNLYAETLLKTLGRDRSGVDAATAATGRAAVRRALDAWGVAPADLLVADGSGLSRYNLATAAALTLVLARVGGDDRLRSGFEPALPLAGQDGTLERRMQGTPAAGNARAKTGSFSNARALAGFVRTAGGEPLAFAVLANNYGVPANLVEKAIDGIVVRLAEFRGRAGR